jgi:hypothetical protein
LALLLLAFLSYVGLYSCGRPSAVDRCKCPLFMFVPGA